MIYSRGGSQVRFTRMGKPEDAALEGRSPDRHDRERCAAGQWMVGTINFGDGWESGERLFDLALLRADGGSIEIRDAAIAAGNTILAQQLASMKTD